MMASSEPIVTAAGALTLNAEQQKTVHHFGSPLLILAGAGSGKTRVITAKIAHLMTERAIPAWAIVALTFTNKAANEMRERAKLLHGAATGATICTFHAFGARFLRRYAAGAGAAADGGAGAGAAAGAGANEGRVASNFTIYDGSDSLSLLKSLFPDDTKEHIERMMRSIEGAKHHGLTSMEVGDASENGQEVTKYYRAYQRRLDEIGNVDFGDLILKPLSILRNNPHIREAEQRRIQVLLVDEYQDTNHAQYQLIQHLYHEGMYLCAVGDDDQSIYAFRGSDVTHIVNFPQYFRNTAVMQLLRNYRSTQPILALASHIIANNQHRHQKQLYTEEQGGTRPRVVQLHDDYQEASFIAKEILAREANNTEEVAIVYRTNAQSRIFESEFNRRNISYRVVGGLRFYAREEVKDMLAYLKFIVNTQDEVSLKRIINKPARGIGQATIGKLVAAAAGGDFLAILIGNAGDIGGRSRAARRGCEQVARLVQYGRALIMQPDADQQDASAEMLSIADLLHRVAEESGLAEHYRVIDRETASFKSDNIAEFIASASYYPATAAGLNEFLEQAELQGEREQDKDAIAQAHITLITMHNTKGLEFDAVYIVGLQDGLFPRTIDLDKEKIEEERRLFYVAITRAKKRLTLTTYELRHQYGRVITLPASRFLAEIDDELVDRDMQNMREPLAGGRFAAGSAAWGSGGSAGAGGRSTTSAVAARVRAASAAASSSGGQWQRRQLRRTGTASAGGASANNADAVPDERAGLVVGTRVFHDDYGVGEVRSRKEDGGQHILGVQFESGKLSHFIEKYAALERVAVDQ